jgi:hypothetical protein
MEQQRTTRNGTTLSTTMATIATGGVSGTLATGVLTATSPAIYVLKKVFPWNW